MPLLEVTNLSRSYGSRRVLSGVDLAVDHGEVVALIGRNGAGKTTLLRILTTLLRPEEGKVLLSGHDLGEEPEALRRKMGVVLHSSMLYPNLSCRENLRFFARLYNLKEAEDRISGLLSALDLLSRADERVRTLSRGMLQRLALARALVHDPDLLLLDEVFTGLDLKFADRAGSLLKQKAQEGKAILFSTHDLERVLEIATRVDILHGGRIVFSAAVATLSAETLLGHYRTFTADRERSQDLSGVGR
ncbi:MAG: heme ABC exporter ATP-binding protein CcmA [Chloroflexi bacterium]|nr:heme ABC exporter ATP-binding protein CcmA [Chloroflexota bacterium]